MIPFLDVHGINAQCADDLMAASSRILRSGHYVLGPELEYFEFELAASQGVRHAIGVGNGLDALSLTLMALGLGPGDEVIVPGHTFIATWLAVTRVGATIVPVDVRPDTYNIDVEQVEAAVTGRTSAIVPVHLYGGPADMEALNQVARRHGLPIIADGAQSIGAYYGETPIATHAAATTLSFYPAKNLGALGDGGAVLTDDAVLARQIRSLRNYGSSTKYVHEDLGVNSRLDELQAAFLRVKLPHLPRWNRRRAEVAEQYLAGLANFDLALPGVTPNATSAWHLFVIRTSQRTRVQDSLHAAGIQTLIHYPRPPARQGAYRDMVFNRMGVTEELSETVLSLPMCPLLTDDQVAIILDATVTALTTI